MTVVRFPRPPDQAAVADATRRHHRLLDDVDQAFDAERQAGAPVHDMLVRLPKILEATAEAARILRRYVDAADETVRATAAAAAPPAVRAAADHDDPHARTLLDAEKAAADVTGPTRNMRKICRDALVAIQTHGAALADMRLPPAHPPAPPPDF